MEAEFKDYVENRGADALSSASAEEVWVAARRRVRRQRHLRFALPTLAVVGLGVGIAGVYQRPEGSLQLAADSPTTAHSAASQPSSPEPSTTAVPSPPTTPTAAPTTVEPARTGAPSDPGRAIEEQLATGWVGYSAPDVSDPDPKGLPLRGYLRVGADQIKPGKDAVYDAPNGTVIGYAYAGLGFVSLEDDPAFDDVAARRAVFGCDPVADSSCQPKIPGS